MTRTQTSKPSISAVAGTYYGKPAIIVSVEGCDGPKQLMTYGESGHCDETLCVGAARTAQNGLSHSAKDMVLFAGLQPWQHIEREFAESWNAAALAFNSAKLN
jgi:hypothetical protein